MYHLHFRLIAIYLVLVYKKLYMYALLYTYACSPSLILSLLSILLKHLSHFI